MLGAQKTYDPGKPAQRGSWLLQESNSLCPQPGQSRPVTLRSRTMTFNQAIIGSIRIVHRLAGSINAIVVALLICAGCASSPPTQRTYSGDLRADEQVALVDVPDVLYSLDGSTRDSGGTSYYGRSTRLSVLPGEHTFVAVVPPGHQVSSFVYPGQEKLWYSLKVTLTAGGQYEMRLWFAEQPTLVDYLPGGQVEMQFAITDVATGKQIAAGTRVKGTYEQVVTASTGDPRGRSRVVLIRSRSMVGAIRKPAVYDPGQVYDGETLCTESQRECSPDGWLVGNLGNGDRLTWDRVPGPMWLTLTSRDGGHWMIEEIVTEPNKEYTVELGTLTQMVSHKAPTVRVRDLP